MLGRNSLWAAGAVLAGLMLPSQAMAQFDAHTLTDLNLRVGPGTEYGVIDVIPGGYPVDVLGCLEAYEWCDIEWDGLRGWVSARYLVRPGTTVYLPDYAPRVGVPIISFSFGTYHDRYYRDRPWYRERHGRWTDRDWRDRDRDRDRERDSAEQPRDEPRQTERPREQREAERPREQREARPQQQEREARPQQGEVTQRQGQRSERQGQQSERQGQRLQRQDSRGGPPEELINDRGQ